VWISAVEDVTIWSAAVPDAAHAGAELNVGRFVGECRGDPKPGLGQATSYGRHFGQAAKREELPGTTRPERRAISMIRIRYIMEYIYIKLDQTLRRYFCHGVFA
jgi:hypothetical protein